MRPCHLRRWISGFLLAAIVAPASSPAKQAENPVPPAEHAGAGSAQLQGRVLSMDAKSPVPGAVVRACYLEGEQVFASQPADRHGEYKIPGLPDGYADVTVETPEGIFVANQIVHFLPAGKMAMNFVLTRFADRPPSWWSGREKRETPCAGQGALGSAEIGSKSTTTKFIRSPKGIALISGLAVATLLIAASGGGGGESPASPSQP